MIIITFKHNIPYQRYIVVDLRIKHLLLTWDKKIPDDKFLNFTKYNRIKFSKVDSTDLQLQKIKNAISDSSLDDIQRILRYATSILIEKSKKLAE